MLPDKIHARIKQAPNGCWLWTGECNQRGYGRVRNSSGGKTVAHRVVYELLVGPIDAGLSLDHLCRNHSCVNPSHLEPVEHRENVLRGASFSAVNAAKTVCDHGHDLSGANLILRANGGRRCRACAREHKRTYRQRKRLA